MTIHKIRRHAGIAGQFAITADVSYPDEPTRSVTFTGSTYGGPVVMTTERMETFVSDPGRVTQVERRDGTLMDPPMEPPTIYGARKWAWANIKTNEETD